MVRPQFTPQQQPFLVIESARCQGDVAEVLRHFRRHFSNIRCPSRQTVYQNVNKYCRTGTSHNSNREHSDRRRSARFFFFISQNIEAVLDALQQAQGNQRISSRRHGVMLTQSSFNRITKLWLRLYPSQMIRRHELFLWDHVRCRAFCEWLTDRHPRFLEDLVIGDEACFCMNNFQISYVLYSKQLQSLAILWLSI